MRFLGYLSFTGPIAICLGPSSCIVLKRLNILKFNSYLDQIWCVASLGGGEQNL